MTIKERGRIAAFCVALLAMARAASLSAAEPSASPLVVAVADVPPFAILNEDGTWSGLSVDLWRDIAARLGWRWEPRAADLGEIDALLRDGKVDLALGAVAITSEGEEDHDYSQPYLSAGLGFAERPRGEVSWRGAVAALAHSAFLRVMGAIVLGVLVMGVLITVIERRKNPDQFGGPLHRGVATGVWWAAVTMTTVGYGDATPKTTPGRSLALIWMFVGVVAVAVFTATVTSIMTVGSLNSTVQNSSELFALRLGTVAGGPGVDFLHDRHARFRSYDTPEEALAGLANHEVDAVLAPRPVLRFLVNRSWHGVLRVSPLVLQPVSYAIGLPSGSRLREPINRALLHITEQDQWRNVEHEYLGHMHDLAPASLPPALEVRTERLPFDG